MIHKFQPYKHVLQLNMTAVDLKCKWWCNYFRHLDLGEILNLKNDKRTNDTKKELARESHNRDSLFQHCKYSYEFCL